MKPKFFLRNALAFLTIGYIAPAFSETTEISQSDADSRTIYTMLHEDQNYHYYQFTESVHFSGYDDTSTYSGNIFRYSGPRFQVNILQGDEGMNYDLIFSNNSHILSGNSYSNVHAQGGAAAFNSGTFRNFKSVQIYNNSLENLMVNPDATWRERMAGGGGISAVYLTLDNVGLFLVEGNTVTARDNVYGGGVRFGRLRTGRAVDDTDPYGDIFIEGTGTGDIIIRNNTAATQVLGSHARGGGMSSYEGGQTALFHNTGSITITGNSVGFHEDIYGTSWAYGSSVSQIQGGGFHNESIAEFKNTGQIIFAQNRADATSQDYLSVVEGGAMRTVDLSFVQITAANSSEPSLLFSDNSALRIWAPDNLSLAMGGAVDTLRINIEKSGDVLFENNYATDLGGAIHLHIYYDGKAYPSYFFADEGNITFKGNTHQLASSNDRVSGIANAIFIQKDLILPRFVEHSAGKMGLYLSAQEGRRIEFYDPVQSDALDSETLFLNFNANYDGINYEGDIVFSGKYVRETLSGSESSSDYETRLSLSRKSDINAALTLNRGTLILEEGVTLGRKYDASAPNSGTGATFFMREGSKLDISGTSLNGNTTLAAQTMVFQKGTLVIGDRAFFDAGHIDMSSGIIVDLRHYMSGNSFVGLPGIGITAESITFGGELTLADYGSRYYSGTQWGEDASFVLFHLVHVINGNITGEFESIISAQTGSPIIDDPYQYKGEWSLGWEDDKYVAYWTVKGDIENPDPGPGTDPGPDPGPGPDPDPEPKTIDREKRGELAVNSLWNSASNLRTFADAGRSQWGSRRLYPENSWNYWVTGLGDFSRHSERGGIDGYEYQGGGYAVGADRLFNEKWVAGLAFGQLIGKSKSRDYTADIDQNSLMGMIYGGYTTTLSDALYLNLEGTAAYGSMNNKLNSYYSDGKYGSGKWDNNSCQLTFESSLNLDLQNGFVMNFFAGLEYTYGHQESFQETGTFSRHFGSSELQNLALPVGVGLTKRHDFENGMVWINGIRLSYIPDIVRKNPESTVRDYSDGQTWNAHGISPARNAGRLELNTRLLLNPNWTVYAGYAFEGRQDAILHRVHAGVSYSF